MIGAKDLRGYHCALVTPVTGAGALDEDSLQRLVGRVLDGGVNGICTVGSTGEGPRMKRELRGEVTSAVRALAPDHVLIATASALNPSAVLDECRYLEASGADAILLAPPSYYPMHPAEIRAFFTEIADVSAVPLVVYNIPAMTKVDIPPDVLGALATHPNVIGVKDSSRDMERFQSYVYATEGVDFSVLTGIDAMLIPSLAIGAEGSIAASANLVPDLGRRILESWAAGDIGSALEDQRRLFEIVSACRVGSSPAGWKAALSLLGLCDAALVRPGRMLDPEQLELLERRLRALAVLP